MPSYRTGTVDAVLSERPGLQRVSVDGQPAYVLTQLIGTVAIGDEVVCNTTAVELGLGSGGWNVVHWNLSRRDWSAPGTGHVMKLRYSSLQVDTGCAEEHNEYREPANLRGAPVVCAVLHSQVLAVVGAIHCIAPDTPIAFVQTDSAALPLVLSDTIARLDEIGWIHHSVTVGQAFGGDYEAVSFASGLLGARGRLCEDSVPRRCVIVAGPGIGVVGTGTRYGFGGIDTAAMLTTVHALGGTPIHALRYSDVDGRERHRGVSHHSRTIEALANHVAVKARPADIEVDGEVDDAVPVDVPDFESAVRAQGLELRSMGRTYADDPAFFRFAAAAGAYAAGIEATLVR